MSYTVGGDAGEGEGEDEVFLDCGASPELRRSTRTSARKRSSTGGLPVSKPKKRERKMLRSPARVNSPSTGDQDPATARPADGLPAAPPVDQPRPGPPQDPILVNMQSLLSGMESGLSQAITNLHSSVTVQIDGAMNAIGDLGRRVDKNEAKLNELVPDIGSIVDSRIAAALPQAAGGPAISLDQDGTLVCLCLVCQERDSPSRKGRPRPH